MVRAVTQVLIQLPSREVANWYRSHTCEFTVTDSGNIHVNQIFITTYREANIRGRNLREYFPFTSVVSHNSWKLQKYGNKTRVTFKEMQFLYKA